MRTTAALALVLALVLSACGSGTERTASQASGASDAVTEETHEDGDVTDDGAHAASEDADRVVDIEQNEDPGMVFSPDTVDVATGETVTFRITNAGELRHEFTLGDEPTQEAHEEEMAAMGGGMAMHDEPNAVAVEPGQTKELTWTFTERGEVLYGCHEPGHYAAGMIGTLTVG